MASLPHEDVAQSTQQPRPSNVNQPEKVETGKLLSGPDKTRYIGSRLWHDFEEDDIREVSEEEDDRIAPVSTATLTDPLSGALLGVTQDLLSDHPNHVDAMKLWTVYVQNVESLSGIGLKGAGVPRLFHHFAIFSMTDENCVCEFERSRTICLSKYQIVLQQALVNASWLRTTDMLVMQAYVLYLVVMRTQIDPHTFWTLIGVGIRIAQRMGLHRDGEPLGLPPFDVEMRRRLCWQLLPLDGFAGQVSGTGISVAPNQWDTKQPLNINDDQIYPGMKQQPEGQRGASEMLYCLAKAELSKLYIQTGVKTSHVGATIEPKGGAELEKLIDEVESAIEMKYLRYCDIVNPVHFLTLGMVRSAANAVRLRNRMRKLVNQTIGDQERRELCSLAQKILDTDRAAYSNPKMKKFHWSIKGFFRWDALMCILTSLAKVGFFSRAELDTRWSEIADIYLSHPEILETKRALYISIGKVTLKAWIANPPSNSTSEPSCITMLRSRSKIRAARRSYRIADIASNGRAKRATEAASLLAFSPDGNSDATFSSLDELDLNLGDDFNLDTVDWIFWD